MNLPQINICNRCSNNFTVRDQPYLCARCFNVVADITKWMPKEDIK